MAERNEYQRLTSVGPAAILVIRVRGPASATFIEQRVRFRGGRKLADADVGAVLRGELLGDDGETLDDILLSVHARGPTLDVRLHLHGSPALAAACGKLLEEAGFRAIDGLVPPEEDFAESDADLEESVPSLWSAADALDADAYALLPDILTEQGARWLLAQTTQLRATLDELALIEPLEEARRRALTLAERVMVPTWFLTPLRVALVGPPNAGKSTLANALTDQMASLVSDRPGTTRDWIEVAGEMAGLPVTWLDTAGVRAAGDALEEAGIAQTRRAVGSADVLVLVLDAAADDPGGNERVCAEFASTELAPVVAWNKTDVVGFRRSLESDAGRALVADKIPQVGISAAERSGLERLGQVVLAAGGRTSDALKAPAALSLRQYDQLRIAAEASDREAFRAALDRCRAG